MLHHLERNEIPIHGITKEIYRESWSTRRTSGVRGERCQKGPEHKRWEEVSWKMSGKIELFLVSLCSFWESIILIMLRDKRCRGRKGSSQRLLIQGIFLGHIFPLYGNLKRLCKHGRSFFLFLLLRFPSFDSWSPEKAQAEKKGRTSFEKVVSLYKYPFS